MEQLRVAEVLEVKEGFVVGGVSVDACEELLDAPTYSAGKYEVQVGVFGAEGVEALKQQVVSFARLQGAHEEEVFLVEQGFVAFGARKGLWGLKVGSGVYHGGRDGSVRWEGVEVFLGGFGVAYYGVTVVLQGFDVAWEVATCLGVHVVWMKQGDKIVDEVDDLDTAGFEAGVEPCAIRGGVPYGIDL